MSTPVAPANPNRKLFIGAGVGCGCLSLIIAIIVIIFVVSSLGRSQSQTAPQQPQPPQPQGQPQPPQPPQPQGQPQPPQPAPQGEGIEGLKVQLTIVKVQGDGENARPGAPTDTFALGENVGAFGTFVEVRGGQAVHVLWYKIDGDKLTLATKPYVFNTTDEMQGKNLFFRISGLSAGDFGFAILKNTGSEQFQRVAVRRFRVQ